LNDIASNGDRSAASGEGLVLFRGALAVVTGAGSGIGRALVESLAKREARAIIAVDRNSRAVEQTAQIVNVKSGTTVVARTLDVTDERAVSSFVDEVAQEFGAIDLWFSNAGINCGSGLGNTVDWRAALDVNLLAHVYSARYVLPEMEQRRAGSFVLTASAAGLLSDIRNAPYTVSKHALVGLAEWLAIGVGEGVRISCVCPEGVLTGMTKADSKSAGPGINFMEAEEVAERTLIGVAHGEFLVLTHPRTGEFEARRIQNRQSWIDSMRKARTRSLGLASLFPA
jgi:NAD(P)-dependent dehydrogenase (short-subunit alcohol dehydrogenase family)